MVSQKSCPPLPQIFGHPKILEATKTLLLMSYSCWGLMSAELIVKEGSIPSSS